MARGLSDLQKTILEMAYERFLKDKEESEHFHGTSYEIYVGPALPSDDYLEISDKWERRRRTDAVIRYCWKPEDVEKKIDEEIEHNKKARAELEQKVEEAAPELVRWYGNGERNNWQHQGKDRDGLSWHHFGVGSPSNNAPEARRLLALLKERGLPWGYTWRGGGVLYTREILQRVYRFESNRGYGDDERTSRKFNPKQIGEERYNRARASISRALKRLANRMLIEHSRDGIGIATITLEGIAELTGQTVKEVCITHNINRTDSNRVVILGPGLDRKPDPKSGETLAGLQSSLHPAPPPLAEALFRVLAEHMIYNDGTLETEIKEAFEEALQRIRASSEETVKSVSR